jgi:teichuronic acid biosynthesis glycosyltransferase TuaG
MPQVSIIMPNYNGQKTIVSAVQSVLDQTETDFELLIIDDCSTDNSRALIKKLKKQDKRIRSFSTEKNTGSPNTPRNIGVKNAVGRFIAFLDSDDIWFPDKLAQELPCFKNDTVAIVFSNYEKMDALGNRNNRIIYAPEYVTYRRLLKSNCIGNLTALYDTKKVGKICFIQHGHEDYILWLTILSKEFIAQNCGFVTSLYRESKDSISHNKLKVIKWQWDIYRNILHLSFIRSAYYFFFYIIKAFLKIIK